MALAAHGSSPLFRHVRACRLSTTLPCEAASVFETTAPILAGQSSRLSRPHRFTEAAMSSIATW
eukprot:5142619-Pyramimonas_sp.AAC.1